MDIFSSREIRLLSPGRKATPNGTIVTLEDSGLCERQNYSSTLVHLRSTQHEPCRACGDKTGAWLDSEDRWLCHPVNCDPR